MDRIVAAKGRVRSVRAELEGPARHFPCVSCRYYELACTHPAISKISVDPESGLTKAVPVDAKEARSEEGMCGPEGALFDSRSLPGLIVSQMLMTNTGRWTLGVGAFLTCCALFG